MIIIIIIILALILLAAGEIYRELHGFEVTVYSVTSRKLKNLNETKRVVFLSDLHCCVYGKNNQELLEAVREAKPDLILIGGDMLIRSDGHSYDETAAFLMELPKLCDVYYANGNHEQKLKEHPEKYQQSYEEYKSILTKAGIRFLENTSDEVCWDTIRIRLTGLEIPLYGYESFRKKRLPEEEITERIGLADPEAYQILLAHHPAYMKEYIGWGADLILSGHYHGGIVRLPGIGGLVSPGFLLFPRYSGGLYQEGDQTAMVSRGLGTHSIPVRLMNLPELVVLELRSCENEKNPV